MPDLPSDGCVTVTPRRAGEMRARELSANSMSALPPKADMCTATAHVRFGPKADIVAGSVPIAARELSEFRLQMMTAAVLYGFMIVAGDGLCCRFV